MHKLISKGAEYANFSFVYSTFHFGVKGLQKCPQFWSKPLAIHVVHGFGQEMTLAENHTMPKHISSGPECWQHVLLGSIILDCKKITSFRSKRLTIVHGFRPETENFNGGKRMISSERACQEEHNGANVSFVAPPSEELRAWIYYVHTYIPLLHCC